MSNDAVAPYDGLGHFLNRASVVSGLTSCEIASLLRLPNHILKIDDDRSVSDQVEPDCLLLVRSGLVTQRWLLSTGKQQVVGFFVPGDIANLPRAFGEASSATFHAHPGTALSVISRGELLEATYKQPKLLRVFLREIAVETRRAQEWLVNIGSRRAVARLAHFFLEFAARSEHAGLRRYGSYELPFSQALLSDMLGLSLVHTNKSYRSLQKAGLVSVTKRRLTITDYDGLRRSVDYEEPEKQNSWQPVRQPQISSVSNGSDPERAMSFYKDDHQFISTTGQ